MSFESVLPERKEIHIQGQATDESWVTLMDFPDTGAGLARARTHFLDWPKMRPTRLIRATVQCRERIETLEATE